MRNWKPTRNVRQQLLVDPVSCEELERIAALERDTHEAVSRAIAKT